MSLKDKIRHYIGKKSVAGVLFLFPAYLIVLGLMVFPIAYLFYLSFHEWVGYPVWTGLSNFKTLFQDQVFLKSLFNTFFFTVVNLTVGFSLSFAFALMMNRAKWGIKFFRAVVFSPVVMSSVVVAVIWMWILDAEFGFLNLVLTRLPFVGEPVRWLGTPWMARLSISGVNVWLGTGLSAVILLAGLQGIPRSLYDAAKVDGANPIQQFFYVTLPQMRDIIIIVLILKTIGSFKTFGQVYVMTYGGPLNSTSTVVFSLYRTAFTFFDFGYAAAMAVVLFLIVMLLAIIQLRFRRAS